MASQRTPQIPSRSSSLQRQLGKKQHLEGSSLDLLRQSEPLPTVLEPAGAAATTRPPIPTAQEGYKHNLSTLTRSHLLLTATLVDRRAGQLKKQSEDSVQNTLASTIASGHPTPTAVGNKQHHNPLSICQQDLQEEKSSVQTTLDSSGQAPCPPLPPRLRSRSKVSQPCSFSNHLLPSPSPSISSSSIASSTTRRDLPSYSRSTISIESSTARNLEAEIVALLKTTR